VVAPAAFAAIGHRPEAHRKRLKPKLARMYMLLLRHVAIGIAIMAGLFTWAWADGSLTGRRKR
jgi:hypothetical protein